MTKKTTQKTVSDKQYKKVKETYVKKLEKKQKELLDMLALVQEKERVIQARDTEILRLRHSLSWRVTLPLRISLKYPFLALMWLKNGMKKAMPRSAKHTAKKVKEPYEEYVAKHMLSKETQMKIRRASQRWKQRPKISIIVPVYNVAPKWLNACIESVLEQIYENWELCLYDDASTNVATKNCLKEWSKKDKRIKVGFGKKNKHISLASNEAIKMATGKYIALLDNDDAIQPEALFEMVKVINGNKQVEWIYSDEDKIDTKGKRSQPFFKPDFSLDLFYSVNYICHFTVIKKTVGDKVGWFRKGFEGAQDFDLFLRLSEVTQHIYHIPKILYHWRMLETSTAKTIHAKNYAHEAGEKALREHFKRKGIEVTVSKGFGDTNYKVTYTMKDKPLVSIIIPFKDKVEYLKTCVESILEKTDYQNYELLLVDNNSTEEKTKKYLKKLEDHKKIRVFEYNIPFNFSKINNWAAKKANGSYYLFLNNDTEVINKEWLFEMLQNAQRKEVGAVGAKLFFPNDTIQHAGVVLGMTGLAGHIFSQQSPETTYFSMANFQRNYLAVTAACLMVEKKKFWSVGGYDERFTVCGNDVKLCLSLYEKGLLNVYTPYAQLYHFESLTRDPKKIPTSNFQLSKKYYAPYLDHKDPYYNPNLSLANERVELLN